MRQASLKSIGKNLNTEKTSSNNIVDLIEILERIYHAPNINRRMEIFAEGLGSLGWGRVHVYIFDKENKKLHSVAYHGMTKANIETLEKNRMDFDSAQMIISNKYEKFRIGGSYYFPFDNTDEIITHIRNAGTRSAKDPSVFAGWHPQDLLYFPLVDMSKTVVGLISVDDPVFKVKPNKENLLQSQMFIDYFMMHLCKNDYKSFYNKTQDYLSRMFFTSPIAIFFLDKDDRIINANPAATTLLDYNLRDYKGMPFKTLISLDEHYQGIMRARRKKEIFSGETLYLQRQGNDFWGYTVSVPVIDAKDELEGYLNMIIDMTEEKRLQQFLIRAEKMAGIGVLASGIAHELNNPLYGILGLAETIVEEDNLETIKEYASDIVRYSKEAAGIIRDLSGYSYSSRTETNSTVDINATISKALQMMKRLDKLRNVNVISEFDDLPVLNASAGEIQQIFINLITNAMHSMKTTQRKVFRVTTKLMGDFVRISFEDTGIGISKENMAQVFEPFYTTKELGKGTGLGLYICYRIAMKYQGRLDVESELGIGTSFILTLPVKRQ